MFTAILALLNFQWRNLVSSLDNISIDNLQLMHYQNVELSRDITNHDLTEYAYYTASLGDGRDCNRGTSHFRVLLSQCGPINNY
jgi:hypothetical protein